MSNEIFSAPSGRTYLLRERDPRRVVSQQLEIEDLWLKRYLLNLDINVEDIPLEDRGPLLEKILLTPLEIAEAARPESAVSSSYDRDVEEYRKRQEEGGEKKE